MEEGVVVEVVGMNQNSLVSKYSNTHPHQDCHTVPISTLFS